MRNFKSLLFSAIFVFSPLVAQAQVLDPSHLVQPIVVGDCLANGGTIPQRDIVDAGGKCLVNLATTPAFTGTGTPVCTTGYTCTDTKGNVTSGTSATSVVITFGVARTTIPACSVDSESQLTSFTYVVTTTAITITQTATTGNKIDYICP